MPMDQVAERVTELAGPVGLDVIGLGCGDGNRRGSTHAVPAGTPPQPESPSVPTRHQPAAMLCSLPSCRRGAGGSAQGFCLCASRATSTTCSGTRRCCMPRSAAHRRRIVCMFGNTFANLQNEIMFVRNSLLGFAPGDFLLLNVPSTMASADKQEEIHAEGSAWLVAHLPSRWPRR
jgi:hypothetical protein